MKRAELNFHPTAKDISTTFIKESELCSYMLATYLVSIKICSYVCVLHIIMSLSMVVLNSMD